MKRKINSLYKQGNQYLYVLSIHPINNKEKEKVRQEIQKRRRKAHTIKKILNIQFKQLFNFFV